MSNTTVAENNCSKFWKYLQEYKQTQTNINNLQDVLNYFKNHNKYSNGEYEKKFNALKEVFNYDSSKSDASLKPLIDDIKKDNVEYAPILLEEIKKHVDIMDCNDYETNRAIMNGMYSAIQDGFTELFEMLHTRLNHLIINEPENYIRRVLELKNLRLLKSIMGRIHDRKIGSNMIVNAVKTENIDIVKAIFNYNNKHLTHQDFLDCIKLINTSKNTTFMYESTKYLVESYHRLNYEELLKEASKNTNKFIIDVKTGETTTLFDMLNSEYESSDVRYYNVFIEAIKQNNILLVCYIHQEYLDGLDLNNKTHKQDIFTALFEGNASECAEYLLQHELRIYSTKFVADCLSGDKLKLVQKILYEPSLPNINITTDTGTIPYYVYISQVCEKILEYISKNASMSIEKIDILISYLEKNEIELTGKLDHLILKALDDNNLEMVQLIINKKIIVESSKESCLGKCKSKEMTKLIKQVLFRDENDLNHPDLS